MKKIAFVLLYIGKFNNYFPLFLRSCENNPTVDFLIFTDNDLSDTPQNVKIIKTSFDEIKKTVQSKYDFKITLDTPYDFCDFKVAYGEIFSEYLKGYDYWGFCDCDLIFGNIRKFLSDDILESYDKIYLRGHCTLFKNISEINTLYRNEINGVRRYEYCFTHAGAHHFDEGLPDQVKGINMIFKNAKKRMYDSYDFMDVYVNKFAFIQADFTDDDNELEISQNSYFLWDNGELYRCHKNGRQPFMYIHLQKRKMDVKLDLSSRFDKFVIIPNKFIPYSQQNESRYLKMNKDKFYLDLFLKRVKKKLLKG